MHTQKLKCSKVLSAFRDNTDKVYFEEFRGDFFSDEVDIRKEHLKMCGSFLTPRN